MMHYMSRFSHTKDFMVTVNGFSHTKVLWFQHTEAELG